MDKIIQLMNSGGTDNLFPNTKNAIDTSNILASVGGTTINYTATQDCWVCATLGNNASSNNVLKIDGVGIGQCDGSMTWSRYVLFVKKGQVVTTNGKVSSSSLNVIYGCK